MAIREELTRQFNDLCVEPSDDVLDKCCELCILENIDPETFVESWIAYSLSHLNGAEPTVETIQKMVKKEFSEKERSAETPKEDTIPLNVYNTPTSNPTDKTDSYCTTPKSAKSRTVSRSFATSAQSPRTNFSPASFSPDVGTPCSKYRERTNAGQVVLSHGSTEKATWHSESSSWVPTFSVMVEEEGEKVTSLQHRLMMEMLAVKADIMNDRIESLSKLIIENNKLEEPSQFKYPNSEKFVTVGRIFSSENRLQANNIMLESSETFGQGFTVELNIHEVMQSKPAQPQSSNLCIGLFPGQVVAVEGANPLGSRIIAKRLFSPTPLPLAPAPSLEGALQIAIAAGPFTQTDNLLYEPLEDFVAYLKANQPHLAIIVGPIVDVAHPGIVDGSLAETYKEFSDKILTGIVRQLSGTRTRIVVVASARDAAQCPVYPTVPEPEKSISGLTVLTDPSLINLNGLVIGVSATDILMHLSREEIALSNHGDRLGRLASHLLSQHSFYPLYPPNEDVPMDSTLWESIGNFTTVTPHIMVLPSDLRYFIKNVVSSIVVNPERLAKGQAGGSFARLEVQPSTEGGISWSPATHICGQILKI